MSLQKRTALEPAVPNQRAATMINDPCDDYDIQRKKVEKVKKMIVSSHGESIRFGCELKWGGEGGEGRKSPRRCNGGRRHVGILALSELEFIASSRSFVHAYCSHVTMRSILLLTFLANTKLMMSNAGEIDCDFADPLV